VKGIRGVRVNQTTVTDRRGQASSRKKKRRGEGGGKPRLGGRGCVCSLWGGEGGAFVQRGGGTGDLNGSWTRRSARERRDESTATLWLGCNGNVGGKRIPYLSPGGETGL